MTARPVRSVATATPIRALCRVCTKVRITRADQAPAVAYLDRKPTVTNDTEQLRQSLVALADAAYSAYPEFAHRWDDWQLGRLTRRAWLFGRSYGEKGEYVLVDSMPELAVDGVPYRKIFSNINKVEAHLHSDAVEVLA